jgi:lipoate synthase
MPTEYDEARALVRAMHAERLERAEMEVERLRADVRRLLEERDEARQSVVDLTAHISETTRARGVRIRRARRWHRSTR